MEERGAIIADHADDDPGVEGDDASARPIGCFEMCHSRIKIPESARVAYREGQTPESRVFGFPLAALGLTQKVLSLLEKYYPRRHQFEYNPG